MEDQNGYNAGGGPDTASGSEQEVKPEKKKAGKKKEKKAGNGKKKIAMAGVITGVVVIGAFFLSNCWYSIAEEQQAVVCTMGRPAAVTEPGLHFKLPLIQTVQKVNTTIQGFAIGYSNTSDGKNASYYDVDPDQMSDIYNEYTTNSDESLMITSDYNFINIDFYVEYRYSDPVKAVYASREPVKILKNVAQNCIRTVIGSYPVDAVLTTGKNEIQANIRDMIMDKLEKLDIGVQLINITIQDAEPPTEEVMTAFKAVETAKQGKDTAVNNANKYRNELIPAAQALADQILQDAQAKKEERINEAEGQVARFNAMYEEYIKYPEITRQRMFYEAMEDVLPQMKVIIQGSESAAVQELLPLDSFTQSVESSEGNSSSTGDDSTESSGTGSSDMSGIEGGQ